MSSEEVLQRMEHVMGAALEAAELRVKQLHWRYGIGMTALGAALVIAVILLPRCAPDPVVPPAVQARLDSLEATHQADAQAREQLRQEAASERARAARAAASESSARRVADSLSRVITNRIEERVQENNAGTSPALPQPAPVAPRSSTPAPAPRDTGGGENAAPGGRQAAFWRDLYVMRSEEADSLRSALYRADNARESWARADSADLQRADAAEARAAALERVNRQLATAASSAEKSCRVLWAVSCPSRRTSFIAGVVTGAATIVAVTR